MADLLVDEGIGQDLVRQLRAQGLSIFHALEFHPKGTNDAQVFLTAQSHSLTLFTWNRNDYLLLAVAWRLWGLGDHFGIISRPEGKPQLPRTQVLSKLEQFCMDSSSFINRIELF